MQETSANDVAANINATKMEDIPKRFGKYFKNPTFESSDFFLVMREGVTKKVLADYSTAVNKQNQPMIESCIKTMRELGLHKNEFSSFSKKIMEDHPDKIRYGLSVIKAKARTVSSILPGTTSNDDVKSGRLMLSGTLFTSRKKDGHELHKNLTAVDEIVNGGDSKKLIVLSVQSPTEVFEGTKAMASESIQAWGATSIAVDVSGAEVERLIFPIYDHSFISVAKGKIVTRDEILPALTKLNEKRTNGWDVLIHCAAGKARSSTVTIAYLMEFDKKSLSEAAQHVYDCRAMVGHIRKRNPMQKVFLVSYFLEKCEKDPAYLKSLSSKEIEKNCTLCKQLIGEVREKCAKKPRLAGYVGADTCNNLDAKVASLLSLVQQQNMQEQKKKPLPSLPPLKQQQQAKQLQQRHVPEVPKKPLPKTPQQQQAQREQEEVNKLRQELQDLNKKFEKKPQLGGHRYALFGSKDVAKRIEKIKAEEANTDETQEQQFKKTTGPKPGS